MGWPAFGETEGPTVLGEVPLRILFSMTRLIRFSSDDMTCDCLKNLLNEQTQKETGPEPDSEPLTGLFLIIYRRGP